MPSDFDGFAVLAAMAARPDLFEAGRVEAAKAARLIAAKQIKAPRLPLAGLRAVRGALGGDAFADILDGMKDAEVKALVKRLDGHDPAVRDMAGADGRRRLIALATDRDPAERPARAKATRSPATPKAPGKKAADAPRPAEGARTLTSEAMAARSPRRKARPEP